MIVDDRDHEFWIARENDEGGRFVCGDALNLTRAHGDSVRLALERHAATLEARARSLRTILSGALPERAELRLTERYALRTTQVIVRPSAIDDELAGILDNVKFGE